MKKILIALTVFFCLAIVQIPTAFSNQEQGSQSASAFVSREIPARTIPVPSTVSDELKKLISKPLNPALRLNPSTNEEWRMLVSQKTEMNAISFVRFKESFPVDIEHVVIGGVKAQIVTPKTVSPQNADRVLIHLRGGGYVFNAGEGGLGEAVLMAHHGKFKVISVDYRMAPEFPFPAALEDSVSVYREVIKAVKPRRVGIFGTSAGGGLTAAAVLKLQELNIPLPAVVGLGTPWADLSKTSDSLFTNEFIDDVLVGYDGLLGACARVYAGDHDLKHKLISPVYAEYTREFPPAIFTTGSRDLFLSDTVRLERKLRLAGVTTLIQIFEGMSHAQYIIASNSPESKEAFEVIAEFFQKHLER